MSGSLSLNTVLQIGVPPAFVVSLGLRWIYLRVVRRSMLRSAAGSHDLSSDEPRPSAGFDRPPAPLAIAAVAPPDGKAMRAAGRGPWIATGAYVVAGILYALAMSTIWYWAAGMGYSWDGILLFALLFVWPVVIVVGLVAPLPIWAIIVVALICLALIGGGSIALTLGTGITLQQLAANWWNMNGIATLLVLASLARPIRAMGPIVVALTMAATAGVFGMADLMDNENVLYGLVWLVSTLGFSGEIGGLVAGVLVFAFAALLAMLLSYLLLRGIGRVYEAQWISDQSIQSDSVWLIFTIVHTPIQLPLSGFVAFFACALVGRWGIRLLIAWRAPKDKVPRLLLLRVFSLGSRSESLFRAFSLWWRYVGSVRMIVGPDLANTTVEPHEFLDFLGGRLQRRFITSSAVLEQRIGESQLRRDPDGRFRVSSFFCHADTWQMVLRRLARESDLVLMDLRGFTPSNQGCVFELHELLDAVRLEQFLLLVDETTDEAFLTAILQQGWEHVDPKSPNRSDAAPCVRLYRLDKARAQRGDDLVAILASAYGHGLPAPPAPAAQGA